MLSTLRVSACRVSQRAFVAAPSFIAQQRTFSAAAAKLQKGVADELQFEKEQYEKPEIISKLPKEWKLIEKPGNVNMKIEKELSADRICKIEWQLVAPFMDDEMDGMESEGKDGEPKMPEMLDETDFTITIEKKDGSQGMTAFCNTQQGDGHRFVVGNVKVWNSVAERDDAAAYNGPDFEDLEDKIQESMDEYLGEIGITDEIYDYIDASATDKENREYMRWLENLNTFLKAWERILQTKALWRGGKGDPLDKRTEFWTRRKNWLFEKLRKRASLKEGGSFR